MNPEVPTQGPRYVVISPVRNEEQYLPELIRCMAGQTIRPLQWILVDDGSSDATGQIIDEAAARYSWVLAVHRTDGRSSVPGVPVTGQAESQPKRGTRALQAKEIEAFYHGFERAEKDWDYIVKLDGDVGFDPDYFESCFQEFSSDPQLGIGGGLILNVVGDERQEESTPRFHVRGATKIYRRSCWDAIGGVVPGAGWDTVDEVKANMLGWGTRTFEKLIVLHYRPTGAANGGWRNAVKNGLWSYVSGYHPLYMVARCARRILERPVVTGSIGMMHGYLLGYFQRVPQIDDPRVIQYLREQQLRRLSIRRTIWK